VRNHCPRLKSGLPVLLRHWPVVGKEQGWGRAKTAIIREGRPTPVSYLRSGPSQELEVRSSRIGVRRYTSGCAEAFGRRQAYWCVANPPRFNLACDAKEDDHG